MSITNFQDGSYGDEVLLRRGELFVNVGSNFAGIDHGFHMATPDVCSESSMFTVDEEELMKSVYNSVLFLGCIGDTTDTADEFCSAAVRLQHDILVTAARRKYDFVIV